jgi:hypothetical protein
MANKSSYPDENEATWHEALLRLETGDTSELAALLRGGRAIPSNARRALAELLDPETHILDMRLVLKKDGRAKAEQMMRRRSRAIVELEKERAKGLDINDAAEAAGKTLGISGRMVLKRADLRNPATVARAHREVSKLIAAAELSGDPGKFLQIFAQIIARATPWKPGS